MELDAKLVAEIKHGWCPQGVQMKDSAAGEADKMRESPTCDWYRENTGCDRAVPCRAVTVRIESCEDAQKRRLKEALDLAADE